MPPDDQVTSTGPDAKALPFGWSDGAAWPDAMLNVPWQTSYRTMLEAQKIMGEAFIRELDVLGAAQTGYGKGLEDVLSCRRPQDLPAAYASLMTVLLEAMARHAEVSAAYASRLRQCCGTLAETRARN